MPVRSFLTEFAGFLQLSSVHQTFEVISHGRGADRAFHALMTNRLLRPTQVSISTPDRIKDPGSPCPGPHTWVPYRVLLQTR